MQICSICGTKIREGPKPYAWGRDDLYCGECGMSHYEDAPPRDVKHRTKRARKQERIVDWTLNNTGGIL